jgi:hypothetical protein
MQSSVNANTLGRLQFARHIPKHRLSKFQSGCFYTIFSDAKPPQEKNVSATFFLLITVQSRGEG